MLSVKHIYTYTNIHIWEHKGSMCALLLSHTSIFSHCSWCGTFVTQALLLLWVMFNSHNAAYSALRWASWRGIFLNPLPRFPCLLVWLQPAEEGSHTQCHVGALSFFSFFFRHPQTLLACPAYVLNLQAHTQNPCILIMHGCHTHPQSRLHNVLIHTVLLPLSATLQLWEPAVIGWSCLPTSWPALGPYCRWH